MKCPICGAADLVHDTRDLTYIHKGESTIIPAVTGDFCPACGEVVLDRKHGDRYGEMLGQFQRQANAAFVAPAQPHYTLDELLAQCDPSNVRLSAEDREWLNARPVGRES